VSTHGHNPPTLGRFRSVKPKAITLSSSTLVETTYFNLEQKLPLILQPLIADVDLVTYAAEHRELIQSHLLTHGAVLFRGFEVYSLRDFQRLVEAISGQLMDYSERSSPRTQLGSGVYTSTDHPADQHILLHNEQSYTLNWPMKIWFFCVQPALEGGRTPIADSRRVYQLLDEDVRAAFDRNGVMYVRNYGAGIGLPWQEVFGTNDRSVVEEHCRRNEIDFVWRDANNLTTRQVRPAVRKHPHTGELVWFNHALFFNVAGLEPSVREALLAVLEEDELPYNTFYGDGTPIDRHTFDAIEDSYRQETVSFSWQERDLLMVDNMLVSHGREPFVGPRNIAVAMSEPYDSSAGA